MANALRILSVYVEETEAGRYVWVIGERDSDGAWSEVARARAGVDRYRSAMADGLVALEARVEDLDDGPRAPDVQAPDEPAPEEAPPVRKSMFGFGPVR